jgi:hypothetical protein
MTIRRGDIDSAGLDRVVVLGVPCREWSGSAENTGESAGDGAGKVNHDEHGTGKIGRQAPDHFHHRFNTAGGSPHHNDVSPAHAFSRMLEV